MTSVGLEPQWYITQTVVTWYKYYIVTWYKCCFLIGQFELRYNIYIYFSLEKEERATYSMMMNEDRMKNELYGPDNFVEDDNELF